MIGKIARCLRLRWLAVLLLNLLWSTMGGAAALPERVDFGGCTPAAKSAGTTSRAARREAMRQEGIPTSQQPISQSKNASGRENPDSPRSSPRGWSL